jgi:2-methylisocitrate lyase-like PEP mutase family enzyme
VDQQALAEQFRSFHKKEAGILVMATAWDAASARLFEHIGARAIATTSLGMANVLGYSDGEAFFPPEEMLWLARRIVRSVRIPVSLDIEAGYGDPERMTEQIIGAGAVGINIEDHRGESKVLLTVEEASSVVKAVKKTALSLRVPVVINARTDALAYGGSLDEAIERCNRYLDAGADCVLPVGAMGKDIIARLIRDIRGPVNIMPKPGTPTIPELAAMGVARTRTLVFGATQAFAERVAKELFSAGTFSLIQQYQPYPDLNKLHREK